MRFSIGPYVYRVRIADRPIVFDGKVRRGLAVHSDRAILISPHVDVAAREEVLRHEVRHAWSFHFPRPSTDEEDCDLHASIGIAFQMDFEGGGGANSLRMMKASDPMSNPTEEKIMPEELQNDEESVYRVPDGITREMRPVPSGERAYCCVCESVINGGAVVVGAARWDERAHGRVRDLTFFCPACDRLQTVTLGCTIGDEVDGQAVVSGPTVEQGRAADRFLIKHPEGAGVLVG